MCVCAACMQIDIVNNALFSVCVCVCSQRNKSKLDDASLPLRFGLSSYPTLFSPCYFRIPPFFSSHFCFFFFPSLIPPFLLFLFQRARVSLVAFCEKNSYRIPCRTSPQKKEKFFLLLFFCPYMFCHSIFSVLPLKQSFTPTGSLSLSLHTLLHPEGWALCTCLVRRHSIT